jgi:hypothetical protein
MSPESLFMVIMFTMYKLGDEKGMPGLSHKKSGSKRDERGGKGREQKRFVHRLSTQHAMQPGVAGSRP